MTIIRQWAITNSTRGDMRRLMNEDICERGKDH